MKFLYVEPAFITIAEKKPDDYYYYFIYIKVKNKKCIVAQRLSLV